MYQQKDIELGVGISFVQLGFFGEEEFASELFFSFLACDETTTEDEFGTVL